MAVLPGISKKAMTILVIFIITQVLVVIMVWVAFSGSDEREGRIRATLAVEKVADLENAIAAYYEDRKVLPVGNDTLRAPGKLGSPYFTVFEEGGELSFKADVANGVITLTFSAGKGLVAGKSLIFFPRVSDGKLAWGCDASALAASLRPPQCKGQ